MLQLSFNRYPEITPKDEEWFFFIFHQKFYSEVISGFAKAEYTWDNDEGNQVIYTGKETEEEIKELTKDGYKLTHFFIPEEGSSTPYGHFLWCPASALGDLYVSAFSNEFKEKEDDKNK